MSQLRKLKYHEQKLLKKTNFLEWKKDDTTRESAILRRYNIEKREDYQYYNRMVNKVQHFVKVLSDLPQDDSYRIQTTENILNKAYSMGLIATGKSLAELEKITSSAFCRRRLPVIMVRVKMAQTLQEATTLIKHGHVRVGPDVITDPAYLVTRNMEDFVTWVDTSKIKQHIMKYSQKLDDFDLLGE